MTSRLLIAGSGVAAVEAVLALRQLVPDDLDIDMLAASHALVDRPASVAAPFGLGAAPPLDLHALARRFGVGLLAGELDHVDARERVVRARGAGELSYDRLLVAVGARPREAVAGALMFRGPADVTALDRQMGALASGGSRRLAVVVPAGVTWSLPAYELAVMAATDLRMRGASVGVSVVTAEHEPLRVFGFRAGGALRALLAERGIALRTGARAVSFDGRALALAGGERLPFDAVVSLPRLAGPRIGGLPADDDGFLPTDAHGAVKGVDGVYAAGDATSFPVKQGGLATQQADAAAEAIAADLGAPIVPRPFAPVLRGLLLTGGAPLYLRAEPGAGRPPYAATARSRELRSVASTHALWWPPGKVAGRYLAPWLATARPAAPGDEPLVDRVPGRPDTDPGLHESALDFALLLAAEDAEAGDLEQALVALDAAAALAGGVLPAPWAERRERWRGALTAASA